MDRFQEMRMFLAVAEEGGFAAAARRLNTSPPSVTRAIAALEQRIGTRLLSRTTRSLHLTEAGHRYLDDCRRILCDIDEAEEAAAGSYRVPCGHLSVTASVLFGELFIAPLLAQYVDAFPSVHLKALLVDRVVNMAEEGIDVAVRIGHLHENNQHAIKVGEVRQVICGTPDYFARYGRPQHPNELSRANIVMSSASHLLSDWQFAHADGPLNFASNRVWWSPRIRRRSTLPVPAGALPGCCLIKSPARSRLVNWSWCWRALSRRRYLCNWSI